MRNRIGPLTAVGLILCTTLALGLLAGCNSDDVQSLAKATKVPLFAGDRNGDILLVSPKDGTVTPVLNTSYTGLDIGVLSAMAYRPQSHKIYLGIGGNSPSCARCILTLNPATGVTTFVANFGCAIEGMAVDTGTGGMRLFACDSFYSFDPASGTETLIAPPPTGLGFGLTYALNGTLYLGVDGTGNGELWKLDPNTGAATLVGPLTYVGNAVIDPFVPVLGRIVSMTTHPISGVIYALLNDGTGGLGPTYLITINPATLVAKLIGQTQAGLDGLAFLPHL